MPYKKSDKSKVRKDEKRKLIFETAARVFADKGYHATAVKDITDEVEISVGTFYLYFKNKEDLFEKLYEEMAEKISAINSYAIYAGSKVRSVEERFTRAIASSIWAYIRYKELSKIMLIEAVGLNPRFEQKYAEITGKSAENMQSVLSMLKQKGLIDVPDVKVAAFAYEGAFSVITYWLRTGCQEDLREYAYPLAFFLLQALKAEFKKEDIKRHIKELFEELDTNANNF